MNKNCDFESKEKAKIEIKYLAVDFDLTKFQMRLLRRLFKMADSDFIEEKPGSILVQVFKSKTARAVYLPEEYVEKVTNIFDEYRFSKFSKINKKTKKRKLIKRK